MKDTRTSHPDLTAAEVSSTFVASPYPQGSNLEGRGQLGGASPGYGYNFGPRGPRGPLKRAYFMYYMKYLLVIYVYIFIYTYMHIYSIYIYNKCVYLSWIIDPAAFTLTVSTMLKFFWGGPNFATQIDEGGGSHPAIWVVPLMETTRYLLEILCMW